MDGLGWQTLQDSSRKKGDSENSPVLRFLTYPNRRCYLTPADHSQPVRTARRIDTFQPIQNSIGATLSSCIIPLFTIDNQCH